MARPRSRSVLSPELIEILSDCGVPASVFNVFADADVQTQDDLLGTNDMMLRSLGVRKGSRVKLNHWLAFHLCHFNMHVYSRNLDVGKPVEVRSNIEFREWEPFLNVSMSPTDGGQFQKLAVLLSESGIQLQTVAASLNVPFRSFSFVLTPVNPRKKKSSSSGGKTWQEQVPKFDDEELQEPEFEEGTRDGGGRSVSSGGSPPPPVPSPPPSRPITPAVANELRSLERKSRIRTSPPAGKGRKQPPDSSRRRQRSKEAAAAQAAAVNNNTTAIARNCFPPSRRTAARAADERLAVALKPSTAHALGRVSDAREEEHNPTTFASSVAASAARGALAGQTVVTVVTTTTTPAPPPLSSLSSSLSPFGPSASAGGFNNSSSSSSSSSSVRWSPNSPQRRPKSHSGPSRERNTASLGGGSRTGSAETFRHGSGMESSSSSPGRHYMTASNQQQGLSSGLNCLPSSTLGGGGGAAGAAGGMAALGFMGLSAPESFVASVTTRTVASAGGTRRSTAESSSSFVGGGTGGVGSRGGGSSLFGPADGGMASSSSSSFFPFHSRPGTRAESGGCGSPSASTLVRPTSSLHSFNRGARPSITRQISGRNSQAASFSERLRADTPVCSSAVAQGPNGGGGGALVASAAATKFRPVYW